MIRYRGVMSYTTASMHDRIGLILDRTRTIAVVGWSPDPSRPSARIARYLRQAGYDVVPVNPTVPDVDGLKSFARLEDVPGPVDMVVVFRRPEEADVHVDEAIRKGGVRAIWLQEGITTPDGEEKSRAAGIDYVEDRCVMVEHRLRYRSVL
jgi:predicted CoA-binding protein